MTDVFAANLLARLRAADDLPVAGTLLPWLVVAGAAIGIGLILAAWWVRERRRQVDGAVMGSGHVRIYLHDPQSRRLERVASPSGPDSISIRLESPVGSLETSVALAFRNRTIVTGSVSDFGRAVLFVPMFAQGEGMGVLEVGHSQGVRDFSAEERVSSQRLADQIAASLWIHKQQSFGLAAGANQSLGAEEARRQRVELNALLSNLMRFREREWKALGIEVKNRLAAEPLYTTGAQEQLEQVFLDMLVNAEQSAAHSSQKRISVTTSGFGSRALVKISYDCDEQEEPFSPTRGVIEDQGGEVRFVRPMPTSCGIEVDVPAVRVVEARREPPYAGRAVTTLVVEPDASRSRRMVHILSGRRYRVVPVSSAEEAIDLVQRLRFDIVFSSTGQLLERVREYVRAFVLVGDSAGTEAAFASTNGGAFVLRNPDDAAEMEQLVEEVKKYLAHQRSLNSQTLRD